VVTAGGDAAAGRLRPPDAARTAGPTSGNTWVNRTRLDGDGLVAGLHWLDFTVRGGDVGQVLDALAAAVGEFHPSRRGTSRYQRKWDGPDDSTVEAGFRLRGGDHIRVSLTGTSCEGLGWEMAIDLVRALGGRPTRVDAAIDGAPFTPAMLDRAWRRGHIRSHLNRDDPDACRLQRNGAGSTVYLGSVKSDRMLRCYDRRGPTRVEMQLRRAMARGWWAQVAAGPLEAIPQLVRGLVAGFLEVAKPEGEDSNRSRWTRLPWWDEFLGGAAALTGLVKRTPSALAGLVAHVWRQAATLATYVDAVATLGHDEGYTVAALLATGRARRSSRHRALLSGVAMVAV
jgi:hypothetical protein